MVECNDRNCPYHGEIRVRGNIFTGKVVKYKAKKTAIIERILIRYVPKYERFKRVRKKLAVHVPDCIDVKEGDLVKVGETRKISKTKSFVVLEVVKKGE